MNLKEKEELDRWRMGEGPARQGQSRDHRHKALRPACGERFLWLKHEGVWLEIKSSGKEAWNAWGQITTCGGALQASANLRNRNFNL